MDTKNLSLPSEVSKPMPNLGDYSTLLYGREKIGKTSFAAEFPDALFLMAEPGGKALQIYKRDVLDWKEFVGYVDLLSQTPGKFKTVVVDTADACFKFCEDFTLKKLAIQHASDEEWGKGYAMIKDEFARVIQRLLKTGRGVIFTSHAVEREIKSRDGMKYDRVMPTMSSQARNVLEPIVDIWAYMEYDTKGERVLHLRGDAHILAGHRLQNHFKGVSKIPMGKTSKEAYENFVNAFNNSDGFTEKTREQKQQKLIIRRK